MDIWVDRTIPSLSRVSTVILKEDKIEASQSRGKKAQMRRLRLLRADFAYWILLLGRLCKGH